MLQAADFDNIANELIEAHSYLSDYPAEVSRQFGELRGADIRLQKEWLRLEGKLTQLQKQVTALNATIDRMAAAPFREEA